MQAYREVTMAKINADPALLAAWRYERKRKDFAKVPDDLVANFVLVNVENNPTHYDFLKTGGAPPADD
jgi:hypothetical protein